MLWSRIWYLLVQLQSKKFIFQIFCIHLPNKKPNKLLTFSAKQVWGQFKTDICHLDKCLLCHFPSFPDRTWRPTRTGRVALMVGPAQGLWPAVTGVWPGTFRRLNLGTTATLTLRLGRAYRVKRRYSREKLLVVMEMMNHIKKRLFYNRNEEHNKRKLEVTPNMAMLVFQLTYRSFATIGYVDKYIIHTFIEKFIAPRGWTLKTPLVRFFLLYCLFCLDRIPKQLSRKNTANIVLIKSLIISICWLYLTLEKNHWKKLYCLPFQGLGTLIVTPVELHHLYKDIKKCGTGC